MKRCADGFNSGVKGLKSEHLNLLELSGPVKARNGITLLLQFTRKKDSVIAVYKKDSYARNTHTLLTSPNCNPFSCNQFKTNTKLTKYTSTLAYCAVS
jgi:hypothetical protein